MLTSVVGINWGDEGKGRMVDLLSQDYDIVVRYQGGNNAGHTVVNDRGRFILNLLPSGILRDETVNVLGPGMVIDMEHLYNEVQRLRDAGIEITPKHLKISDRASICMPYHKLLDCLEEDRLGDKKFGSTRRGISPAYSDRYMKKALRVGELLHRELLDERVARLLRLVSDAESAFGNAPGCDMAEHHEFAARFAEECAVLLKNEDGILPLKPGARVAVIGDFAKTPRYQGAGSSHIEPTKLECGLDALRAEGVNVIGFAPGFRRSGGESRRLREQACKLSESADAVLMWLGLDEGSEAEGVDRQHMRIAENQIRLLREVSEVNPNVVVILSCGSPVEADWDCRAKALLHGYLSGQAGAKAIARLVSGKACPSGKLAETMPRRLSDTPCYIRYPGTERTSEYREGIFVGYRYYDTANKAVKYPFGFGMSYTSFEYGGLEIAPDGVSFTIKNTGSVPGAEIAQVYVAAPKGGVFCPEKELRGFARVELSPGETKRVFVRLPERAYQYWNIAENRWATAGGRYEILVGASSRDIRLRGAVEKPGDGAPDPYTDPVFAPYRRADVLLVPDESFAALLGREIPPHMWDRDAPLEFNSALVQGQFRPGLGRLLYRALRLVCGFFRLTGNAEGANNTEFAMNLPYRGLARFTGAVTEVQVKSLLRAANREKGGLRALVCAFMHKK